MPRIRRKSVSLHGSMPLLLLSLLLLPSHGQAESKDGGASSMQGATDGLPHPALQVHLGQQVYVLGSKVNLRGRPELTSSILAWVPAGTPVLVLDIQSTASPTQEGGAPQSFAETVLKVQTPTQEIGWIPLRLVTEKVLTVDGLLALSEQGTSWESLDWLLRARELEPWRRDVATRLQAAWQQVGELEQATRLNQQLDPTSDTLVGSCFASQCEVWAEVKGGRLQALELSSRGPSDPKAARNLKARQAQLQKSTFFPITGGEALGYLQFTGSPLSVQGQRLCVPNAWSPSALLLSRLPPPQKAAPSATPELTVLTPLLTRWLATSTLPTEPAKRNSSSPPSQKAQAQKTEATTSTSTLKDANPGEDIAPLPSQNPTLQEPDLQPEPLDLESSRRWADELIERSGLRTGSPLTSSDPVPEEDEADAETDRAAASDTGGKAAATPAPAGPTYGGRAQKAEAEVKAALEAAKRSAREASVGAATARRGPSWQTLSRTGLTPSKLAIRTVQQLGPHQLLSFELTYDIQSALGKPFQRRKAYVIGLWHSDGSLQLQSLTPWLIGGESTLAPDVWTEMTLTEAVDLEGDGTVELITFVGQTLLGGPGEPARIEVWGAPLKAPKDLKDFQNPQALKESKAKGAGEKKGTGQLSLEKAVGTPDTASQEVGFPWVKRLTIPRQ